MDVLYLVPYVPNLVRVRSYNFILHLTQRGHKVSVMTISSNQHEQEDAEDLKNYCHGVKVFHLAQWRSLLNSLIALPSSTPLQATYSWHPTMAKHLSEFTNTRNDRVPFDVIHVEHLRGARYGIHANKTLKQAFSIPVVWDSVDCISYLFRQASTESKSYISRFITRLELGRTERYERRLVDQFDKVLVTSQIDKKAFLNLKPHNHNSKNITVLPNGVDLSYFKSNSEIMRDTNTLVISGKMSYHANITMTLHMVNEIMPIVWNHRPDVKLLIVGKDPPRKILALAENPSIKVTGTVPDIRPFLLRSTIAVAPIKYSAGIQNKVLEAMACEIPVVTTPQAVAALNTTNSNELLIAQEPAIFAMRVIELLENPQLQKRFGLAGRKYVEKYHNWDNIASQLEEVYSEIINKN